MGTPRNAFLALLAQQDNNDERKQPRGDVSAPNAVPARALPLRDAGFAFLFHEPNPTRQIDWFTVKPCASGGNCGLAALGYLLGLDYSAPQMERMRRMIFNVYLSEVYPDLAEEKHNPERKREVQTIANRLRPDAMQDNSLEVDDLVLLCIFHFQCIPIVLKANPIATDAPYRGSDDFNDYMLTSEMYQYTSRFDVPNVQTRYVLLQHQITASGHMTYAGIQGRWREQEKDEPMTSLFYHDELPLELVLAFQHAQEHHLNAFDALRK